MHVDVKTVSRVGARGDYKLQLNELNVSGKSSATLLSDNRSMLKSPPIMVGKLLFTFVNALSRCLIKSDNTYNFLIQSLYLNT